MPIVGRNPAEVFRHFADYLTTLLSQTITQMPLIPVFISGASEMSLGFRPGGTSAATPINTRHGCLGLELSQRCVAFKNDEEEYQLQTVSYRYTIGPLDEESEPLFRWEYIKHPAGEGAYYCRHHFQGPQPTGLEHEGKEILFQAIHVPTGWIPIEDVIRFCLHDLGVTAKCDPKEWDRILRDSRERFLTQFSTRSGG